MNFYDRIMHEAAVERAALYAVPLNMDSPQGRITRETYLAYLEQAYHHVKHALPLMMMMGSRLPKEKEWVRRILVDYIKEETGHDDWILGDIKHAGGDVERVRNSKPSLPVELMNAFNYDNVTRGNPMSYFGMIVALEGASTELATKAAEAMGKSMGLGKECFSYLLSHGDLDIEHVQFISKTLNQVTDAQDQADIIHAAKVIYLLYADMCRGIPHNYAKKAA